MKKSTIHLKRNYAIFQKKIHQFIHPSIMSGLIRMSKSSRGKDVVVDNNNFRYTNNGSKLESVDYWRCADRKCSAKLLTRKSSGDLIGKELPTHNHSNKLLQQAAKKVEKRFVQQHALVDGSTTQNVLKDISTSIRASTSPGLQSSLSSAGAIKMALWRERQKVNPRPIIPKDHSVFMATPIPEKYSLAADGSRFLLKQCWVDPEESLSMALFLTDWSADALKRHTSWLLDGTFSWV